MISPIRMMSVAAACACLTTSQLSAQELIAYWNFDDPGGEVTTDLIGGFTATLLNGAVITEDGTGFNGQPGNRALNTAANRSAVAVAESSALMDLINEYAAEDQFTVSYWQSVTQNSVFSFQMVSPESTGVQRGWSTHTPWGDGTIYFDTAGCCDPPTRVSTPTPEGVDWTEWNHVVFLKNQDVKQVWINGEMIVEGTEAAPLPTDFTQVLIANGFGANASLSVVGDTDEFGLIAGVLSEEQIQELASGTVTLPEVFDSSDPSLLPAPRLDFGQLPAVPPTHTGSFIVRNFGETETLTVTGATLSGSHADNFTITSEFPFDVPPRGSANVEVTFDSQGGQGLFAATATFESNDANTEDPNQTQIFARIINLAGPAAHYTLNEEAGATVAPDITGFGRDGEYTGNLTLGATGLTDETGTAVTFDGGSVTVSGNVLSTLQSFSAAMWVHPNSLGNAGASDFRTIIGKGSDNPDWALIEANGDLHWFGGTDILFSTDSQPIEANTTSHVAMVYNHSTNAATIYVNGSSQATTTIAPVTSTTLSSMGIGSFGPLAFRGEIDDVQLYDRALDDEAISWLNDNAGSTLADQGEIDSDGDGLSDAQEEELGTDPLNPDTDDDGITDGDEVNIYMTDPLNPDTDGGGVKDGIEVSMGLDPLDPEDDPAVFDVTTYESTGQLNNLAGVAALEAGQNILTQMQSQLITINFVGTGTAGNFADDLPFPHQEPDEDRNDFALVVRGPILIPEAGDWTFGFNTDDGGRLTINGVGSDALTFNANRGPANSIGTLRLPAGIWDIEFIMWERAGGAAAELFWWPEPGTFTADDIAGAELLTPSPVKRVDSDGDGLDDQWEIGHFGDLTSSDGTGDFDGDGVSDADEYALFLIPTEADTDGDGATDGRELEMGTDPRNPDTDGDGLTDGQEDSIGTNPLSRDTDGDGYSDGYEVANGYDPLDPNDPGSLGGAFGLLANWDFNTPPTGSSVPASFGDMNAEIVNGAAITDDGEGASGEAGDRAFDASAGPLLVNGTAEMELFNDLMANDTYSIAFWQKLNAVTSQSTFKGQSPSSSGTERGISVHTPWSDGTIYYDTAGCCDAGSMRININTSGVDYLDWRHIVFTKDGELKQIWMDGELIHEGGGAAPMPTDFTAFWIGSAIDGAEATNGLLDDFAIFREVLDAAAIQRLSGGISPEDLGGGDPDPDPDPETAPAFTSVVRSASGSVMIGIPAGETYDIEYSVDLDNWESIATGVTESFEDTEASRIDLDTGFYRGVRQEAAE